MKKIFLVTIITILFYSCNDDFLNVGPKDQYADSDVWTDPVLVQSFVNNIYTGVKHGYYLMMFSTMTDEAMVTWGYGSEVVTLSLMSPSDLSLFDDNFWISKMRYMTWAYCYKNIRACNLFLEKINDVKFDNEKSKKQLIGEVFFLRAYFYHLLTSFYGGVPIIKNTFNIGDNYSLPRDNYSDCINFIVSDLDTAATLLSGTDKARATVGAALALKSRVLLYAASELHHNTSWMQGYSHPELIAYTDGTTRQELYQRAKDAADAVIKSKKYNLHKPDPATVQEAITNLRDIFLLPATKEDIWVKYIIAEYAENENGEGKPGLYCGPNGWHTWGGNTPIGQLVDDFEMIDGSRFDWNNPLHASNPYANRDPRLEAWILHEGSLWRPRPKDVIKYDSVGVVQVGYYLKLNSNGDTILKPGLDTRQSPIEDWNGSYTGYYMRKFIDPKVDAQFYIQEVPWRFIRYTEVILNYAEACLGLGQEAEARTYLNLVRKRAKMPDIPPSESGDVLWKRLQNERRIELSFEEHRFFDIRRWMIAGQVANSNARGVSVLYKLLPNGETSSVPEYTVIEVQDRHWNDSHYLLPIKLDEMNKNPNLVQNPLY